MESEKGHKNQPLSQKQLLMVLAGVTALGPFAMQLYLPALPLLVAEFEVSQATVQLTVSLFVLALAISIPFVGPLSDQFGRRPLLLCSLLIFLLGSVLGLFAWNMPTLIASRVVQGIGGAGGLILARAIVSDLYERQEMAQLLARLIVVIIVAPTIAPTAGAFITEWFGWRPLFGVLALFTFLVVLIIWRFLPETLAERRSFRFGRIAAGYSQVLRRPAFLGYTLQAGCSISFFMAFIATVPYLMVGVLGRPTKEFGLYFMLLALGYVAGNLIVSRLAPIVGSGKLMLAGVSASLFGALLMAGLVGSGIWTPLALFGPMALVVMGSGVANPNSQAGAVKQAPEFAGTASSAASFVQQLMGAASIQVMGVIGTRTPIPLAAAVFGLAALSMVATCYALRMDRHEIVRVT